MIIKTRNIGSLMVKWLIFCSFIISLALTIIGLIVDINYQVRFVPQIEKVQKLQSDHIENYLNDKTYFSQHLFFNFKVLQKNDFSTFFKNKLIHDDQSIIPFETKKTVLSLGPQWLDKRHLIKPNEKLDQLFSQVHNFDYWTLKPSDLINKNISATDFIVISQIYLANSIHLSPHDILLSLEQTRHLSRLLLSTQILNFKLAGLSILEKENNLIQYMNSRKFRGYESWNLIPPVEIKKYREFLGLSDFYLSFLTHKSILEKVFLNDSLPIGSCALLQNKNQFLSENEAYLKPHFIFEPSFDDSIKTIKKIKDRIQATCKMKLEPIALKEDMTRHIPYLRRIVGVRHLLQESKNL
jgi:hypothetical protein